MPSDPYPNVPAFDHAEDCAIWGDRGPCNCKPQPDPMTVTHVCPACNRPTHTTQPQPARCGTCDAPESDPYHGSEPCLLCPHASPHHPFTQPQPDAGLREAAQAVADDWFGTYDPEVRIPSAAENIDALRAALRSTPAAPKPDDGLRKAAQPFLEASLNVFPEDWISPGSSYAIAITVRGSEVDALRAALSSPATPEADHAE